MCPFLSVCLGTHMSATCVSKSLCLPVTPSVHPSIRFQPSPPVCHHMCAPPRRLHPCHLLPLCFTEDSALYPFSALSSSLSARLPPSLQRGREFCSESAHPPSGVTVRTCHPPPQPSLSGSVVFSLTSCQFHCVSVDYVCVRTHSLPRMWPASLVQTTSVHPFSCLHTHCSLSSRHGQSLSFHFLLGHLPALPVDGATAP